MVWRHIFNVASGAVAGILVMGKTRGLPVIGGGVAGDTRAGVMPGRPVGVVARLALFNVGVVKPVGNPGGSRVASGAVAGKMVGVLVCRPGTEGSKEQVVKISGGGHVAAFARGGYIGVLSLGMAGGTFQSFVSAGQRKFVMLNRITRKGNGDSCL